MACRNIVEVEISGQQTTLSDESFVLEESSSEGSKIDEDRDTEESCASVDVSLFVHYVKTDF